MKHYLSLGAGVQSSAMALMAKHEEITPMPDAAIFSDTGCEPAEVYDYLEYLEDELPFPIHKVSFKDGLLEDVRRGMANDTYVTVPFFTENLTTGKTGQLRRQCTNDYKIQPIHFVFLIATNKVNL